MGGGALFFDDDNDGWVDIFLVKRRASIEGPTRRPNSYLFHNNRDGTFRMSEEAGLTNSGWGQGCASATTTTTASTDCRVVRGERAPHNNGDGRSPTSRRRRVPETPPVGASVVSSIRPDGRIDLFAQLRELDPPAPLGSVWTPPTAATTNSGAVR